MACCRRFTGHLENRAALDPRTAFHRKWLYYLCKDPANKGRVMRYGVWRTTRHPNYFGEATLWWGCFLIAVSVPGGLWALISPVVIAWLLLCVSVIPMLEAKYAGRPEYQSYQKSTSAFFPWFPKGV